MFDASDTAIGHRRRAWRVGWRHLSQRHHAKEEDKNGDWQHRFVSSLCATTEKKSDKHAQESVPETQKNTHGRLSDLFFSSLGLLDVETKRR